MNNATLPSAINATLTPSLAAANASRVPFVPALLLLASSLRQLRPALPRTATRLLQPQWLDAPSVAFGWLDWYVCAWLMTWSMMYYYDFYCAPPARRRGPLER